MAEIAATIVWWYGIELSQRNQATDKWFLLQISQVWPIF